MKHIAVVLAGGKGSRMNSDIPKQYIFLGDKPVLYYSIRAFSVVPEIDGIIVVTAENQQDFCKKEIIEKYGLTKVKAIVAGGDERYLSVYSALEYIKDYCLGADQSHCFVHIHDGARPCIREELIAGLCKDVEEKNAVIAAVPVKDTIKQVDETGKVVSTPKRSNLWQVQTPQSFSFDLLFDAYQKALSGDATDITDDAMIIENYTDQSVHITPGEYQNIKITTTEDLLLAKTFLALPG